MHLRELLRKTKEWVWGPPQEDAFAKIKKLLTSADAMAHYNSKLQTIVTTDASKNGLGATMYQIQADGAKRPVYYASRSMSQVEKNYAVIEKEALAMLSSRRRLLPWHGPVTSWTNT